MFTKLAVFGRRLYQELGTYDIFGSIMTSGFRSKEGYTMLFFVYCCRTWPIHIEDVQNYLYSAVDAFEVLFESDGNTDSDEINYNVFCVRNHPLIDVTALNFLRWL